MCGQPFQGILRDPALLAVAELLARAGDLHGAEAATREAANRSHINALQVLSRLRAQVGDYVGSPAAGQLVSDFRRLIAPGSGVRDNTDGPWTLTRLQAEVGDHAEAERLVRFGLNDDGSVADPW